MASKVMIDVVSDTVCPWCFIGKRRLETAIRQLQGQKQFEVRWHPFQLNPDAPQAGINKLNYYKEKFGEQRTKSMNNVQETFAKEGLNYTMEGDTGNTLNSHRLIAFAGRQGPDVQDKIVEQLFKAYFTEGKYINDPEVLREAAKKAGVADAEQVISDPNVAKDQVREELREYAAGVTGVPHFIINGKYHLSGAQDPETFAQVLAKA
ncbi:DSBA oxidoreductase [Coccomyxa subellipsoidea C-169]|uniref:DSBA oxidoreductase n=1 Tax=Coccomyxa subellipsoidea (strain C-169) TaxID=574566 RepID=I0YLU0_COCSC|nr:DSBA oxidoreductase [Coccomyxa subellipsoidea C-169]EIE19359.1 DSBA oxidoreductase [Coccomyxa subellipsoidea C-169]|eukprot:XP_005643903.1 DSBA oxidoreductase [Coccomyxa subellipsoidea C-169]